MNELPAPLSIVTLAVGDAQADFVFYGASGDLWFLIDKQRYQEMLEDTLVDDDVFWSEVQALRTDTSELLEAEERTSAIAAYRRSAARRSSRA